jgi:hypothetical protein
MFSITFLLEERFVIENSFRTNTEIDEVGMMVASSPSANPNPPLPEFHVEASKLGCIQFIEVDAAGTI